MGGAGGLSALPLVAGAVAPLLGRAGTQAGTQAGAQAGVGAGQITSPVTPKPTFMEGLKTMATKPETILGAGSLLASMAPKTPQFQMPSSVAELQSKLMSGQALSPLGQQARTELSRIMTATPTELFPTATDEYYNAALRRTRESYAEAGKQLDAAYNVAGVYGSGEHLAEKAKLQENLARTESALAAETEQRRFELAKTQQYQALQDSLGVDKDTMDDLVGLTGLSVQTAAIMYGAQTADVQAIREALGTLGVEMILKGQGITKQGGVTINLAK